MPELMSAKEVRLVVTVSEEVREALRLASVERSQEMSEIADAILSEGLSEEIVRIRKLREKRKER